MMRVPQVIPLKLHKMNTGNYFEALDILINELDGRFQQKGMLVASDIEAFSIAHANGQKAAVPYDLKVLYEGVISIKSLWKTTIFRKSPKSLQCQTYWGAALQLFNP